MSGRGISNLLGAANNPDIPQARSVESATNRPPNSVIEVSIPCRAGEVMDRDVLGFAGLWDTSTGADGVAVEFSVIVTMPANNRMAEIHNGKHGMAASLCGAAGRAANLRGNGATEDIPMFSKPVSREAVSSAEKSEDFRSQELERAARLVGILDFR
jgi:hypothetical protein